MFFLTVVLDHDIFADRTYIHEWRRLGGGETICMKAFENFLIVFLFRGAERDQKRARPSYTAVTVFLHLSN